MFLLEDYNYHLPQNLIAEKPEKKREDSKLLIFNKEQNSVKHSHFFDIINFLNEGDVLVVNNSKVVPARLWGKKESGGKVEVLILNYFKQKDNILSCLIKASRRPKPGSVLFFENGITAKVLSHDKNHNILDFSSVDNLDNYLDKFGSIPLPPYIKRAPEKNDKKDYQTVYAKEKGSVASPTAGLHFSEELIKKIKKKGIKVKELTLHISYGTFSPVRSLDIRNHKMHSEYFSIPEDLKEEIILAKKENRRVIACGTTSLRTLEFAFKENSFKNEGLCDLFVYPGFKFKVVSSLITNFHLPKSTLIMLVSAFAGRENILSLYNEAIKRNYKFFSYGDAMFIS